MKEQIEKAEAAVHELLENRKDRWYPTFHIAPLAGWMNDPTGLSFFKDRYQVYFQHNPYSPVWGPMHWGHVSSSDLVTWRREPIAFAPSVEEDKDGVFSGSAVVNDDTLYTYYTGHRWRNGVNEDEGNLQVQMMATSKDGITFDDKKMIVDSPEGLLHFRDPKVWKMGDTWYMVFGACSADNRGQVWLYTSDDMETWNFDRILFQDPDPKVFMLECPDLFPVGDKWILMYGPMGPDPVGYGSRNGHNAGYVVGNWAPGEDFEPLTNYRPGDWGHNFYAPQSFEAPDGRRILFGWMGAFTLPIVSQNEDGWSGQLTVPREVSLNEDLTWNTKPIAELESLRVSTEDLGSFVVPTNTTQVLVEDAGPMEIELEVDLEQTTSERVGLLIHKTESGAHTFVGYDDLAQRVFIDRRLTGHCDRGYRAAPYRGGRKLNLRIFVDNGSIEVFVDGGVEAVTSFSFPLDGPRSLEISSESGPIHVDSLKIHRLRSIWETPDK